MQPRNLAARAGRWSATHRKTAILGWILFVVLATLIGGKVGQQNLESSKMGNGESKRHDVIVDNANFPDEIGERVLIQGKGSVTADSPQVTAAVKDVVNRLEQIKGVENIESPLNAQQRANTVSKDGRSVLVTFTMPGKAETKEETEALEHAGRRARRGRRRRPEGAPRAPRRGARRRVRAEGPRRPAACGRGQGEAVLDGRHAAHPPAHVRRARRRRHPAPARRDLDRRDDGAARAAQPAQPAARGRCSGRDAHRPRRRRRLRHVLPPADAGGAGQGPLPGGRAGRRRRHVGSRGADLRLHRHRRDGRHVLLRQRDLLVLRHRHDPRCRRRDDRVAHVPPGGPVLPRPEGLAREGPPAVHRQAPPQEQGRVARLERDPQPRPGPPRPVRGPRRRPARRAGDPGARHAVQGGRHRGHVPQPADHPDARPHRRGLPRRQPAGHGRHQGQGRHGARGPDRDQAAPRQGDRHGSAVRAHGRRRQRRQDRRGRVARDQGQGHRRRVGALARDPARRGRPGHRRQARQHARSRWAA